MLLAFATAFAATGEITVDDEDAAFLLTGSASDAETGGYLGHFYYRAAASTPTTFGRWTPPVPETGLYTVSGYVPLDPATTGGAPITMHAQGEIVDGTHDQSIIGGDFHSVFGGRSFKLVAGGDAYLEMNDGTGESSSLNIGFDAFRFTRVGDPGAAVVGDPCATTPECADVLVCDAGLCREPCTVSGCAPGGTCDLSTGLCDLWPVEGSETGLPTSTDPEDTGLPTDTGLGPQSNPHVIPGEPKGCGCATGGHPGWALLLVPWWRRRRPRSA